MSRHDGRGNPGDRKNEQSRPLANGQKAHTIARVIADSLTAAQIQKLGCRVFVEGHGTRYEVIAQVTKKPNRKVPCYAWTAQPVLFREPQDNSEAVKGQRTEV